MLDAGYLFLREAPLTADNREGYLLELTAPYGRQDDTYLVAVFAVKKKIVIVEAAGEVTQLAARRKATIAAIRRLKFWPVSRGLINPFLVLTPYGRLCIKFQWDAEPDSGSSAGTAAGSSSSR